VPVRALSVNKKEVKSNSITQEQY